MKDHVGKYCPFCGEDAIDYDPPYAACYGCGWEGRIEELTDERND